MLCTKNLYIQFTAVYVSTSSRKTNRFLCNYYASKKQHWVEYKPSIFADVFDHLNCIQKVNLSPAGHQNILRNKTTILQGSKGVIMAAVSYLLTERYSRCTGSTARFKSHSKSF